MGSMTYSSKVLNCRTVRLAMVDTFESLNKKTGWETYYYKIKVFHLID